MYSIIKPIIHFSVHSLVFIIAYNFSSKAKYLAIETMRRPSYSCPLHDEKHIIWSLTNSDVLYSRMVTYKK